MDSTLQHIQAAQQLHRRYMHQIDKIEPFEIYDDDHTEVDRDDNGNEIDGVTTIRLTNPIMPALTYMEEQEQQKHQQPHPPATATTSATPPAHQSDTQQMQVSPDEMPGLENAQGQTRNIRNGTVSSASHPPAAAVHAPHLSPSLNSWLDRLRSYHSSHCKPARSIRDALDEIESFANESANKNSTSTDANSNSNSNQAGWKYIHELCERPDVKQEGREEVEHQSHAFDRSTPSTNSSSPSTPLSPPLTHALLSRYIGMVCSSYFSTVSSHIMNSLVDATEAYIAKMGKAAATEKQGDSKKKKRKNGMKRKERDTDVTVKQEDKQSNNDSALPPSHADASHAAAHLSSLSARLTRCVSHISAIKRQRREAAEVEAKVKAEEEMEEARRRREAEEQQRKERELQQHSQMKLEDVLMTALPSLPSLPSPSNHLLSDQSLSMSLHDPNFDMSGLGSTSIGDISLSNTLDFSTIPDLASL